MSSWDARDVAELRVERRAAVAARSLLAPVPAIVVIVPPGDTTRTRALNVSPTYRLPSAPTAMPSASSSRAELAGPPSPANPGRPWPATVEMIPARVTSRTEQLPTSEM